MVGGREEKRSADGRWEEEEARTQSVALSFF